MDGALVEVFLNIITRITLGKQLQPEQTNALMGGITDALDEGMRRILLPPGGKALTAILPVGRRYRRARRTMLAADERLCRCFAHSIEHARDAVGDAFRKAVRGHAALGLTELISYARAHGDFPGLP